MKNFLLAFVVILCISTNGYAAPKYEADVSVDVTAQTVSDAKQKAISKAMRDALSEIVLSISTAKSVKELNQLNDNQLEHFVTGVMVLMEKTSDVRYIADLRVSFDEKILKAYMAENNMPIIIGEEQDILIIPLLEDEKGNLDIWGDENIWREALISHKNKQKGNLTLIVAEKNLGNIAMIKANNIYDMPDGQYQELKNFNRVDGIYVLKYSLKDKKIYIKSFPTHEEQSLDIIDETPINSIDAVFKTFKDVKKDTNTEEDILPTVQQIEVVYSYPKLSAWAELKHLLNDNPQVQDINIVSMSNGKVHFNFKYSGIIEKLQANLSTHGYTLKPEGEYYVIN